jgi:hypothetical protein
MATTKGSTKVTDTPAIATPPPTNGNAVTALKFTYPAKKELSSSGTIQVALGSLVPLDETSIPNAELAMRELDENNVVALYYAYKTGKTIPPLLIQQSSEGNIIVGGMHRREALTRIAQEQGLEVETQSIEVKPAHLNTQREVLNAAYLDNFSNGLGASGTSRSRYALQLIAWDAEDGYPGGKPMSLHKAAEIAGCTHQAVMKMRDKLAGKPKTKKMVDTLLTPEDEAEIAAMHTEEASQPELVTDTQAALNKAAKTMFTSLAQVFAINPNVNELAVLFRNFITKDTEKEVTAISLAMQAVTMNRTFGQRPGTTK